MHTTPNRSGGDPFVAGMRTVLPLAIGILPFGVVYGVAAAQSSVPDVVGGLASVIVLAGAAQLALIDLLGQGAPWAVAVLTALVINARFVMWSAALAPAFAEFPVPARYLAAHLMTDQAAVTALLYFDNERDPSRRLRYYVGAGGAIAMTWFAGTAAGLVFSAGIPQAWDLGFAVPLVFLSLLVPALRDRPSVVTALTAVGAVVVFRGVPFNLGIVLGAMLGVAAGLTVRR